MLRISHNSLWLPFNVESERGIEPRKTRESINRFVSFSQEKDKMFSRFYETAKNSPFADPYSVTKCSSDSTPAPRRTRIMAAPKFTDGRFSTGFLSLRSLNYPTFLAKLFLLVIL